MRLIGLAVALTVSLTLAPLALAPLAAEGQQAGKVYRIGWLSEAAGPNAFTQIFLRGLRDLGYVEGQRFVMEYRLAAGKRERLPELAADLVQAKVDVIVTAGTAPTLPAVRATGAIPIVFVAAYPVERGIVASLARPGGNVTGVALHVGLAKHLQLLKESVPKISRVAYFRTPGITLTTALATFEAEARRLGVKLDLVPVSEAGEVERAFSQFTRNGTNGVMTDNATLLLQASERLCGLALKQRLPAMGRGREFADAGCLMSYGENLEAIYRRVATYVDKILKGVKPADLPVEQATKLELVINLKTAKALGLTIPQALLLRADHVIE